VLAAPGTQAGIWSGWLMSWETDYATDRDVLLEAADEPYDPLAAMVQTWNPVNIYLPATSAVLGELTADRLAAIREVAAGAAPAANEPARPGRWVQCATAGGRLVLTGTPLAAGADPRQCYRNLYTQAAARYISAAVKPASTAGTPQPPWWQRVITRLQDAAATWGETWQAQPLPALSAQSAATATEQAYHLGQWLRIRLIPAADDTAVQLHLTLLQTQPLQVGLLRQGQVRQQVGLAARGAEADLFVGVGQELELFVWDAAGNTRLKAML